MYVTAPRLPFVPTFGLIFILHFLSEALSDNEDIFSKEITKWSSNDLMDKIETMEVDDAPGQFSSVNVLKMKLLQ